MNTEAQDLQIKIADMESKQGQPEFNEYKLNAWKSRLAEIKSSQEQVETAVASAQERISNAFNNLNFDGNIVSLRDICINPEAYTMLYVFLQTTYGDMAERAERNAQALKESYAGEIADKEARLESVETELAETLRENNDLSLKLQDMTSKHAAATQILSEKDDEIAQLTKALEDAKADVSRLEKDVQALRDAATAKAPVLKTTDDFKQEVQESMIPVTNIRWKEGSKNTRYEAEDAKTGETIEFSWLAKGKYREVTAEEAVQFRNDQAESAPTADPAPETAEVPAADSPLVIAPPEMQFPPAQVPNEDTVGGVDAGDLDREMASQTVTRQEFEQLKAEVAGIKASMNQGAAA